MISYRPLWETMQKKDITTYQLIICPETIQRGAERCKRMAWKAVCLGATADREFYCSQYLE